MSAGSAEEAVMKIHRRACPDSVGGASCADFAARGPYIAADLWQCKTDLQWLKECTVQLAECTFRYNRGHSIDPWVALESAQRNAPPVGDGCRLGR